MTKTKCAQAQIEAKETLKRALFYLYFSQVLWRVALSRCQAPDLVSPHPTQQLFPSHPLEAQALQGSISLGFQLRPAQCTLNKTNTPLQKA